MQNENATYTYEVVPCPAHKVVIDHDLLEREMRSLGQSLESSRKKWRRKWLEREMETINLLRLGNRRDRADAEKRLKLLNDRIVKESRNTVG